MCVQALHSRQIPMPELLLQWGDLGYSEAIVPLGPVPSAEAKTVDFLQYMTVGALTLRPYGRRPIRSPV